MKKAGKTTPEARKKSLQEGVQRLKDALEKEGIRLTHQRIEIFKEIAKAEDHPSAEELYKRIRRRLPTISLDTVYRTLDMLEQIGVVSRVEVLDGRSRFDPNVARHHHLICTVCESVQDFLWPAANALEPPPETRGWGEISGNHIELRGICANCRANARAGKGGK